MGDSSEPILLDRVREAHYIRSRLAALSEMEQHLIHISETIRKEFASSQPRTAPYQSREPN